MGLKQLLLQGQTTLSVGSFPGDTPINDPQSGFVQDNLPNDTYVDETFGQPNNGSALINTLDNTGLDNTVTSYDTSTPPPPVNTDYPQLSRGEFGGVYNNYNQVYGPNNTYLSSVSIEDTNSPQLNTLDKTSLDNTNQSSISNIPIPNNISSPTDYLPIVSGEFGNAPSQYESQYNASNTYLSTVGTISVPANNNQVYSLDNTGLDNLNSNFDPTTFKPNNISSPTNYGNISPSPNIKLGEYGGAPSQYSDEYSPANTYLNQIDSPEFNGIQISAITGSGLDTDLTNSAETVFTVPLPDTITTYPADNVTHNTLSSGTNSAPKPFNQIWNDNNDYYEFMKENWEGH
jgi:hypothetical protein